jgi:transposase, IS5 family
MTHQPSFAHAEFAAKKKTTRRERFLTRMDAVIPWPQLLAVIEPFYPQGKRGRPPIGLERMLRVYFLQHGMAWPMKPSKTRSTTVRRSKVLRGLI